MGMAISRDSLLLTIFAFSINILQRFSQESSYYSGVIIATHGKLLLVLLNKECGILARLSAENLHAVTCIGSLSLV